MDTIERLAREVYDEMKDEEASAEQTSEYVDSVVPAMTTTLFQMVVEDNSLAFLDYEGEADTPFAALAGALFQAIEAEVHKLRAADPEVEDEEDEEDEDEDGGIEVNITALFADQGSIVVFKASRASDGAEILIAADHRMAQDIVNALEHGEHVQVEVAPWQIVGGS